jgi:hypothetical protein
MKKNHSFAVKRSLRALGVFRPHLISDNYDKITCVTVTLNVVKFKMNYKILAITIL